MPLAVVRTPKKFQQGFARIRTELDVPAEFPADVLADAEEAYAEPTTRVDATHLGFVAIDPPGATDLDQAFAAERNGDGYRVFYAIADVGAFVQPGSAIDAEARNRGATLYSPDMRTPLHPPVISEDRASLLPGSDKPSLLWTIDLDDAGLPIDWRLERATVQVREAISYRQAQDRIDAKSTAHSDTQSDDVLQLLSEIGKLRQQQEIDRGGVSLNLPAQEVVEQPHGYGLAFDRSIPVENWNAQISLLTGIVAGQTMSDAGIGILRTLPPPRNRDLRQLRKTAKFLGLDWNDEVGYPDFVRSLNAGDAATNTFLLQSTRVFRGAGYLGFSSETPSNAEHGAIASVYSHVTAPLRRLVDRFGNEILLALYADEQPPTWAVEALDELPSLMGQARQRESSLERAMLDLAEALVMESRIGDSFPGLVVNIHDRKDKAVVQIAEPAVVSSISKKNRSLAEEIELRVDAVDIDDRRVTFTILNDSQG